MVPHDRIVEFGKYREYIQCRADHKHCSSHDQNHQHAAELYSGFGNNVVITAKDRRYQHKQQPDQGCPDGNWS